MAVILITHNLGVVAEIADEVAVMYLGRVVERAPVDEIFYAPKHPYTRALLRSLPSVEAVPLTRLPTISGSIPHAYHRPAGCPVPPEVPRADRGRVRRRRAGRDVGRAGPYGQVRPLRAGRRPMSAGGGRAAPVLEVRGLRKVFPIRHGFLRRRAGEVRAVDDVSFVIERGETLALVGESGCGKTTTARCILRVIDPDRGARSCSAGPTGRRSTWPGCPGPASARCAAISR